MAPPRVEGTPRTRTKTTAARAPTTKSTNSTATIQQRDEQQRQDLLSATKALFPAPELRRPRPFERGPRLLQRISALEPGFDPDELRGRGRGGGAENGRVWGGVGGAAGSERNSAAPAAAADVARGWSGGVSAPEARNARGS